MKNKKEVCELIERFTTDDVLRPQLRKPWIVDGVVYATDGRIAIRIKDADGLDYERVNDYDWRASGARSIDRCCLEGCDYLDGGNVEYVDLPMSYLRKAAYAAMDDARIYAYNHYPEMTAEEAVDRYSLVILPGAKRHVIAARYAAMVCDAVDAFGAVRFYMPVDGFKRGDYRRYRIWCPGAKFDILLMCVRSDKMDTHGLSIADSATATLVHCITDESDIGFERLRFGGVS